MYPCTFCSLEFTDTTSFMVHVRTLHKGLLNNEVVCPFINCCRSFGSVFALKRHMVLHNEEIALPFEPRQHAAIKYTINSDLNSNEFPSVNLNNCSLPIDSKAFNFEEHEQTVRLKTDMIVSKLYSWKMLPRSHVSEIIEDFIAYYNSVIFEPLREISTKYNNSSESRDVQKILEIAEKSFQPFKTEYRTFKHFEQLGHLIQPLSDIVVDTTIKAKRIKGERKSGLKEVELAIVPLKLVLTKFLELPNVFSSIKAHMDKCKRSEKYVSIIQSNLWKETEKRFDGKDVLPLEIYFDDYEINKAIGSHTREHEIGGTYAAIACLPDEYKSMIENILIFQLHHTKDHKSLGNMPIFSHVIDQLVDLEENGVEINLDGKKHKIYFALIGIIADNLGTHTILGFMKSFNAAYPCRICLAMKKDCNKMVVENSSLLRTKESYELNSTNLSCGVTESCIFNRIPNFHIIKNSILDFQHDIPIGICRYEVPKILKRFIKAGFFSLDIFNSRLAYFDFGKSFNIPPKITENDIKSEYLTISSSEMSTLIRFLGLIIGDLVPVGNKVWEIYTLLREIICIIMARAFHPEETIQYLTSLIKKHHTLYLNIFEENLKPKHHHLLHYPSLMLKFGPPMQFSCERFEGKHKESKDYSKAITSRLNPAHSLIIKHQLRLCYRFMCNRGFEARLSFGGIIASDLRVIDDNSFKTILPQNVGKIFCVPWVKINGTSYEKGMIILVGSDNSITLFGKIRYIIVTESKNPYFVYQVFSTLSFSNHYHAYEVAETAQWNCISQTDLLHVVPCSTYSTSNGKLYVPCYK